ncbi:MAG: 4Fe-4S dicluster domain-containing protein [Candidatus Altiarchaeota archaeon]|nr:4Fe-4S dicluster domain-containing protein [Candidatus Altiarchaeota archaeon]
MKKIRESDVLKLINELRKKYEVIAPVKLDGRVYFKTLGEGDVITLDYVNSVVSPKDFFLPRKERILKFRESGGEVTVEDDLSSKKRVFFGIRPCDVNALLVLDSVASEGFADPYYLGRRDNTLLISLECVEPGDDCFCSVFNTGPSLDEGADLVFTDLGDYYLVKSLTDEGRRLVSGSEFLMDANRGDEKKAEKKRAECVKRMENLDLRNFSVKEEVVKEKAGRCLYCYSCTFICPTCYCFDVVDRMDLYSGRGDRMRFWDSCMNPSFTEMAGNFNPRDGKAGRFMNRIKHKLEYMPERQGVYGCVGCGRCISNCPAGISILDIIREGVSK